MRKWHKITIMVLVMVLLSISLLYMWNSKSEEVFIDDPVGRALRKNMIPLKTVVAGNGFSDLNKLKPFIKDKKIIAMGEATHGTKEFFQMKHRMFEFLVEEMGYRVFAMEAGFHSALVVNDYILYGKGSAEKAVNAMEYAVWINQEILEMIEWMKNYNDDPKHKEKIKFYGFDMQSGELEARSVKRFLFKVDKETYLQYLDSLDAINYYIKKMSHNQQDELLSKIIKLEEVFASNRDNYIDKSSAYEYELTLRQVRAVMQYTDHLIASSDYSFINGFNRRDFYMAENVKWIMDYEAQQGNDKIMLWAHNAHIGYDFSEFVTMGKNLREIYGDSYYAIGFDFYKGKFRATPLDKNGNIIAYDLANFNIEESGDSTFVSKIKMAEISLGFIDFKTARDNSLIELLNKAQIFHSIGYGYNSSYAYISDAGAPIDIFDGLIYVESTSAAEGIGEFETKIEDGDAFLQKHNLEQ